MTCLNMLDSNLKDYSGVNIHLQREKLNLKEEISRFQENQKKDSSCLRALDLKETNASRFMQKGLRMHVRPLPKVPSQINLSKLIDFDDRRNLNTRTTQQNHNSDNLSTKKRKSGENQGKKVKLKLDQSTNLNQSIAVPSVLTKKKKQVKYSSFLEKGKIVKVPIRSKKGLTKRPSNTRKPKSFVSKFGKNKSSQFKKGTKEKPREINLYEKMRTEGNEMRQSCRSIYTSPKIHFSSHMNSPLKREAFGSRRSVMFQYKKMQSLKNEASNSIDYSYSKNNATDILFERRRNSNTRKTWNGY